MSGTRILMVAYYFPPNPAVGSLRTLRLARYLAERGWCLTVLAGPGERDPLDEGLGAHVPETCRVWRVPGRRAGLSVARRLDRVVSGSRPRRGRIRRLLSACCSIPDRQIGWCVPAITAGRRESRRGRPDIIYSSAPPWSGHLVAAVLSRFLHRPWVADFRDPWARAPWRSARQREFQNAAARMLERVVIGRVDAAVFATETVRRDFASRYPAKAGCFHVVPNGCDPDDFIGLSARPRPGRFVLTHTGSLYGGRNPMPMFRALDALVRRGALDRERFRLRLVGTICLEDTDLPALVRGMGLDDLVEFVPPVSRRESLTEMLSASALLLLQPGTTQSIPAKLYEYLACGRPILALVEEGETTELVRACSGSIAVSPFDEAALETALLTLLERNGAGRCSVAPSLYDGGQRARELAAVLESVLAPVSARAETACNEGTAVEHRRA